jgi:hypothetical protein
MIFLYREDNRVDFPEKIQTGSVCDARRTARNKTSQVEHQKTMILLK